MPINVRNLTRWKKSEISAFFDRAQRTRRHVGLDIRIAPAQQETGRILIITPARSGNAVERNTCRRRLREIFYTEKLYQKGFDWIVLVNKQGIRLSHQRLKEMLLASLATVLSPS